jgi:hypothetical protein
VPDFKNLVSFFVLILGPAAHFRRLVAALLRWAPGALWGETSFKIFTSV